MRAPAAGEWARGWDVLLLVPSDPLHPRRTDEHFAAEAEAARFLGHGVGTVDHDALAAGDARGAVRLVDGPADDAVYRGWMVRSEHYEALSNALGHGHVRLRTEPAAYQRAHELPGWYDAFNGLTPESRWLIGPGTEGLDGLLRELPAGPAIVKDYVKSMKHYWAEATYISDVKDADGLSRS